MRATTVSDRISITTPRRVSPERSAPDWLHAPTTADFAAAAIVVASRPRVTTAG